MKIKDVRERRSRKITKDNGRDDTGSYEEADGTRGKQQRTIKEVRGRVKERLMILGS